MSIAPFMQLYVSDYLGDTQHLTTEQHGAYLLLLMAMWRNGGFLPNDEKKLARIARVSLRRWHIVAVDIMDFFDTDGGDISQKRLVEEYQKVLSISEKRSHVGSRGGSAKALKNNKRGVANAKQLHKHSHIPDIIEEKIETKVSTKKASADVILEILAEVLDTPHSQAVLDYRRTAKKPLTEHSARLLVGKLQECRSPNDAADEMILRGWTSVSQSWLDKGNPPSTAPPKSAFRQHQDACRAAIDKEIDRIDGNEHSGKIIDLWATTG